MDANPNMGLTTQVTAYAVYRVPEYMAPVIVTTACWANENEGGTGDAQIHQQWRRGGDDV